MYLFFVVCLSAVISAQDSSVSIKCRDEVVCCGRECWRSHPLSRHFETKTNPQWHSDQVWTKEKKKMNWLIFLAHVLYCQRCSIEGEEAQDGSRSTREGEGGAKREESHGVATFQTDSAASYREKCGGNVSALARKYNQLGQSVTQSVIFIYIFIHSYSYSRQDEFSSFLVCL